MNVCSLAWVLAVVAASAFFFRLPTVRLRQAALAVGSLGFLATNVPNLAGWLTLVVFLATGYLAAWLLKRSPSVLIFRVYIVTLVLAFIFIKQYDFLRILLPASLFGRSVALVGISYMLFRQIHLVVDVLEGQVEYLSLWNYTNYQLNLFGLIAGPIQRYQDFCRYWTQLDPVLPDTYTVFAAHLRICIGVIKVAGLAPPCLDLYRTLSANYLALPFGWKAAGEFLLLLYLFPAYLYFNFAGYCDMVVGAASLFGIRMPENFRWPFLSRNLGEFWTRWHRTLGFWIRDYLFTPFFKNAARRWPKHAKMLSFACLFLAFLLAGMWHGSTWNFLLFGFLNGLGVAAAKIWESVLTRRFGRSGLRRYLQSNRIKALAILVNFHFVCFTMLFFPQDLTRTWAILLHILTLGRHDTLQYALS